MSEFRTPTETSGETMATRKRPLGRNLTTDTPRPRIGYLPDAHGQPTQKQPRFNLGDGQLEADYRYALIRGSRKRTESRSAVAAGAP